MNKNETNTQVNLSDIISKDPRAAHFIVDLMSGMTSDDAASRHFSNAEAIADAEQRGYLRAMNEKAEQQMQQPALFEPVDAADSQPPQPEGHTFLSSTRRSVWD